MRRLIWHAVIVLALVLGSYGALAAPSAFVSGGVMTSDDGVHPYLYGEMQVVDDIAVGLEYNPSVVSLSVWTGMGRGLYAQGSWDEFGFVRPVTAELGVWTDVDFGADYTVIAWGGIKALSGDSRLQLSLNAEVEVPVQDNFSVVAGGNVSMLGPGTSAFGWIGLGVRF